MTTFKFALSCGDRGKCLELLDSILNAKGVRASLIRAEVKGDKIVITVFGNRVEALQTRYAILRAYREWRRLNAWMERGEYVKLNDLIKIIGKPFPTDALVEVLRILGSDAHVKGGVLYANAPNDVVINIAKELAASLEQLIKVKPKASYSAKCLITSLAVLQSKSVQEIMEELRSEGFVEEEGHRLLVTSEWRSLLRKLAGEGRGLAWR